MTTILPIQSVFDKTIPDNFGNAEYRQDRKLLITISDLISQSGIENIVINYFLDAAYANKAIQVFGTAKSPNLTCNEKDNVRANALLALRISILRKRLTLSLRKMALALSHSDLYKWFCCINRFAMNKIPGKSMIGELENRLPSHLLTEVENYLFATLKSNALEILPQPLDFSKSYFDCTCISVNIHHPIDWLLLRDATRTLMKAVIRIRNLGLRHRMPCDPLKFISQMNKLCMEMTFAKRKKVSKGLRKVIFRKMKKLITKVCKHAVNHLKLLETKWETTNISRFQTEQILKQITNITDQIKAAVKNAHERLIGERKVKNKDKILSLYEDDVNIVVRKKMNAQVEFGNTLYIAEQENGIIIDWEFYRDSAPADCKMLEESYQRIEKNIGIKVELLAGDRGFDSKSNQEFMADNDIFNAVCPRNPSLLVERLKEEDFCQAQNRRSQTEARISILSHCFCGSPMKQKGFTRRQNHMGLSILSHNLWVVARLIIAQEAAQQEAA
jgi:hypothetical protein